MDPVEQKLREVFGFDALRDGQREVMDHLLAGRSAAAVFPTGSGKSLCYQLPALLLPGLTLVVSPLIALMKDQIDALQRRQVPAERLDSTRSAEEVAAIMNAARAGELRMLYVAPERFNNERFRESLTRLRVSLFAVDEAHCISEWGHNFRPDYLKLPRFAQMCKAERLLALTATATPDVLADICRGFSIAPECAVRTGSYRPNLTVLTTPVTAAARSPALLDRLRSRPPGPTIVYVTLQRTAEQTASALSAAGFAARPYHAGLEDDERAAVQDWFAGSDMAIVAATIAFGMGIDKANIRYVYHFNLPKSLENYSQEIGRSGRDGLPSTCELFACPDDLNPLENFVYGDTPDQAGVRGLVDEVFALPAEFDVSLYELAANHDIRQIVVRTLLTYLELDGYLEEGTPYYSRYQFHPLAASSEILSRFAGEKREFLEKLFRQAQKRQKWFDIDLERAAAATQSSRERVVRALDYLGEQQLIELKVEGVRNRFRRCRMPESLEVVAASLYARSLERETRELIRLNRVLDLVAFDGCQVRQLCEYFGDVLAEPCGHCSWCLNGQTAARLLDRPTVSIDESILRDAEELRRKHRDPFERPRPLARFLCGLSSPRIGRLRLGSNPLAGILSHVPFAEVLQRVSGPP